MTVPNEALQAFQRFADYDAKTDCYCVNADDLRDALSAARMAPPEVTEAMIDAAREHLWDVFGNKMPRPMLRKAIEAALAATAAKADQ